MLNKVLIACVLSCLFCLSLTAQDKETENTELSNEVIIDSLLVAGETIDPLTPSKAAFYSAVLPGLGQAYNKKYWKVPIVWAAIGTGIYFYTTNNKNYNRYRDAYKSRLAGFKNDEFYFDAQGNQLVEPRVTTDGLERAQKFFRRNKELSILVTVGLYALNIIDANVDAHLMQYNVDENLTLVPHYHINELDGKGNAGLTLNFNF
ncbi:hypothetical protein KO566_11220 [Flavobacteriaceae bacterium XHP0103]|uniref:DUF5683 domain-containing protein n=1 Tax=Marixanthotalea marina TaxID=2844359 RepID=UPI002989F809|nr:DUF5683 domain-containing protein [Marixanthotalea marina]MBU3822636.1 hypothetical protein [Marixanthotalea marina]